MSFHFLQDYSLDIKKDMIKPTLIADLTLHDIVIVINYNGDWVIIPLTRLIYCPFLYFKNENSKEQITLVMCLITLRCVLIYDEIKFDKYEDYNMKFKNSDGVVMDFDNISIGIKKSQCKIQSLRSALIEYGDVKYLHLDNLISKRKKFIGFNYYSNHNNKDGNKIDDNKIENIDCHPKTLLTVIQYINKDEDVKTTLLVPKGANKSKPYGYEPKKNNVDAYLADMSEKLVEKKAYIMYVLAYTAKILYKDSKVIIL